MHCVDACSRDKERLGQSLVLQTVKLKVFVGRCDRLAAQNRTLLTDLKRSLPILPVFGKGV